MRPCTFLTCSLTCFWFAISFLLPCINFFAPRLSIIYKRDDYEKIKEYIGSNRGPRSGRGAFVVHGPGRNRIRGLGCRRSVVQRLGQRLLRWLLRPELRLWPRSASASAASASRAARSSATASAAAHGQRSVHHASPHDLARYTFGPAAPGKHRQRRFHAFAPAPRASRTLSHHYHHRARKKVK